MKRNLMLIFVATPFLMIGCVPIDRSKPPEPGAIRIAGHPYWTMPNCKRRQPFGKWDNNCDVPYIGLPRGFTNSDFDIGGPSVTSPVGAGL
jgi:hypothetical protein